MTISEYRPELLVFNQIFEVGVPDEFPQEIGGSRTERVQRFFPIPEKLIGYC
jgi:hypothetical protein